MPGLNWDIFVRLPGSAEKNFELLCRGIVRHNYGSYGVLRALANQPGVEFHLQLDRYCDALGDQNRWWAWQCKWYNLPSNRKLGKTRRKDIEDCIQKTESHVPGITDWVLWTLLPLTKSDQVWFEGISSSMTLHLWTESEIDNLLVGQAAILRGTYFGELILTPEILRERHVQAVAPIRARWLPEIHQVVHAERKLRRMLGESGSWSELGELSDSLRSTIQFVKDAPTVPTNLTPFVESVINISRQATDALGRIADGIRDGDLDLLRDDLRSQPRVLDPNVSIAPRRLRSGDHRAGLYVTNAVAGCRKVLQLFAEAEAAFSTRVVAVIAPAGCGKTQLAAQLTTVTDVRPHGVLLHGRDLHASHTLDDLARQVLIAANPVQSMESLLAAVDAAGQRANHRLPILIDGLNESEDPRIWKPFIATLDTMLVKYPYVLLICTLRPDFREDVLPDGTQQVEIEDFGDVTDDAIRAYFNHYKINAIDALLPIWLLRHPLTLRLFCEVTNPKRQNNVGVEMMPTSLTALFDRFLDQASDRITMLAPRICRYFAHDVRKAITVIANRLWDSLSRSIDFDELRQILDDVQRPWDQSLVRAMEHEGVLLRMPSDGNGTYIPVYDRMGGHIIANMLLTKYGQIDFEIWIRDPSTMLLLAGHYNERHPFADDIIHSLVGQIPRRFHSKQLWQLVDEPLRSTALRIAARLEAAYLDAPTVNALLELVRQGDNDILMRLWEVRGAEGHPLNAEGLDHGLRSLNVADRDLHWTEWIRRNQDEVQGDFEHLERRWRNGEVRIGDRLRARWLMWTLTSTVRRLRDHATRALYWFGRNDPEGLFELTIDSLSVNDAYVSERMLAAAYGVVMAHQHADVDFETRLIPFLDQITNAFVGSSATEPTNHYLSRRYVRGIVLFVEKFYPAALPERLHCTWSFGMSVPVSPIEEGDTRAVEMGQTLHMDFENYTLGRLFNDRANYDMNHQGHQAAVAYVRGVVWSLGWRAATFNTLERVIADDAYRSGSRGQRPHAERYGKKYCWIGFFTYAGILETRGLFPCDIFSFSDIDIDPSFPERPSVDNDVSIPLAWLSPSVEKHEQWVRESVTSVPRDLLIREKIGEYDGPWIAVHGFVMAKDRIIGREAWAFISVLVTPVQNAQQLVIALNAGTRPWGVQNVPSDHYTFAGEIPWHPSFATEDLPESGLEQVYREFIRINTDLVEVEILAHDFNWEGYHSEINQAGSARVPSRSFSERFNLHSVPQSFDQLLADGTRATITLKGVDGLEGDILYFRKDLLMKYIGDRAIVWFSFGERGLHPLPLPPPEWLKNAVQEGANSWSNAEVYDME